MATDVTAPIDRLSAFELALACFTTAEKLELIERIARSIRSTAPPAIETEEEHRERQRRTRIETHAAIVALAEGTNDEGFSSRDHDKVLYGSSR